MKNVEMDEFTHCIHEPTVYGLIGAISAVMYVHGTSSNDEYVEV